MSVPPSSVLFWHEEVVPSSSRTSSQDRQDTAGSRSPNRHARHAQLARAHCAHRARPRSSLRTDVADDANKEWRDVVDHRWRIECRRSTVDRRTGRCGRARLLRPSSLGAGCYERAPHFFFLVDEVWFTCFVSYRVSETTMRGFGKPSHGWFRLLKG